MDNQMQHQSGNARCGTRRTLIKIRNNASCEKLRELRSEPGHTDVHVECLSREELAYRTRTHMAVGTPTSNSCYLEVITLGLRNVVLSSRGLIHFADYEFTAGATITRGKFILLH